MVWISSLGLGDWRGASSVGSRVGVLATSPAGSKAPTGHGDWGFIHLQSLQSPCCAREICEFSCFNKQSCKRAQLMTWQCWVLTANMQAAPVANAVLRVPSMARKTATSFKTTWHVPSFGPTAQECHHTAAALQPHIQTWSSRLGTFFTEGAYIHTVYSVYDKESTKFTFLSLFSTFEDPNRQTFTVGASPWRRLNVFDDIPTSKAQGTAGPWIPWIQYDKIRVDGRIFRLIYIDGSTMQAIRAKEKGLARLEGPGGQGGFQHFSRVRLVGRPRYAAQRFTAVTPLTSYWSGTADFDASQSYRVCISSFTLLSHSYHAWTMLHWLKRCQKGGSRVQTSEWFVRKLKECQDSVNTATTSVGSKPQSYQRTARLTSILLDSTGGGWLNAPCSLQFTFAKGVLASVAGRH